MPPAVTRPPGNKNFHHHYKMLHASFLIIFTVLLSIVAVLLAIIGAYVVMLRLIAFFKAWQRKRRARKSGLINPESVTDCIKQTLGSLGCQTGAPETTGGEPISEEEGGDGTKCTPVNYDFHFTFQNGNFILSYEEGEETARLFMPCIFADTLESLNDLRTSCNDINKIPRLPRLVYHISKEEYKVLAGCMSTLPGVRHPEAFSATLLQSLNDCFTLRRCLYERFAELQKISAACNKPDLERADAESERIEHMLAMSEIMHQDYPRDFMFAPEKRANVEELIKCFYPRQRIAIKKMTLIGKKMTEVEGEYFIRNFNVTEMLIGKNEQGEYFFERQNAIISLQCTIEDGTTRSASPRQFIIALDAAGGSPAEALYFRVTLTAPAADASSAAAIEAPHRPAKTHSFLMAFDCTDNTQRLNEYFYMMNDMNDKIAEGNFDECTPEQKFLFRCEHPDAKFNLYWGRRYVRQERYYDALPHLLNAWHTCNKILTFHKDAGRRSFHEMSFLIGLCYLKLELFHKAYYFLDLAVREERPNYIRAYVTCLVSIADDRVEAMVDHWIGFYFQKMHEAEETGNPVYDDVKDLYRFLLRNKSHLLAERHHFAAAERILKPMLNKPAEADYAIGALAKIQQMREDYADESNSDSYLDERLL